jgi:hypothetical protein
MPSHTECGASAYEVVESRRGATDITTGETWEERLYIMQFNDCYWTTFDARNANGIPTLGCQLGTSGMYCLSKEVEPDPADQTVVRCRAMFKTLRPNDKQPRMNATSPIWSVVSRIEGFPTEEKVEMDVNGKICVNCLGDPIQPPLTRLMYDASINLSFLTNSSAYQHYAWQAITKVNSIPFTLHIGACDYHIDAGELFFNRYTVNDDWDENGGKCAGITLDFLWRQNSVQGLGDAWHEKRPNLSFCKAKDPAHPANGSRIRIKLDPTDPFSDSIGDPVYLDASGQPIPAGGLVVMNNFTIKEEIDFHYLLNGFTV